MAELLSSGAGTAGFQTTSDYAHSVIFPPQHVTMQTIPPAWAKHRNDLVEALDFFKSRHGNVYIHNGVVLGFLIDGDSGDHTYLDSEIVIAKFASSTEYTASTRHDLSIPSVDTKLQAWQHTKSLGASVVVIAARSYPKFTVRLPEDYRYIVLENFCISNIWAERDSQYDISYMARLEKCDLLARSWWTPYQERPPGGRDQQFCLSGFHAVLPVHCESCAQESPRVYSEAWICLNPTCDFFFTTNDAMRTDPPASLSFHWNFLSQRTFATPEQEHFKPAYALAPDLVGSLRAIEGSGQVVAQLSRLWKGVVCSRCNALVSKVYWESWICTECDGGFNMYFNPGLIDLGVLVPRPSISYVGHPPIEAKWPANDVQHQGPTFREHYRVDKWLLHGGSRLILISPTSSFNEDEDGPDSIFKQLLRDANDGDLGLHRNQMSTVAENLSQHFEANYGEPYSFSDHSTITFDQAEQSVRSAAQIVDSTCREELRGQYTAPNSIQLMGYLEGMSLPWHTDGTDELGATIATLSLGCDATFRIRLQQKYYNNTDVFDPDNQVIIGAKNWKRVAQIKAMLDAGKRINPSVAFSTVQSTADLQNAARPEIELPLIHGSILIMQGAAIGKYYEHRVDLKGGLRFAVTLRHVNQQLRQILHDADRVRGRERTTGQIFTHEDEEVVDEAPDDEESPVLTRAKLATATSYAIATNDEDEDTMDVDERPARSYRQKSPLRPGRHQTSSTDRAHGRPSLPVGSSQESVDGLRRSTRKPRRPSRLVGEGYYDPPPLNTDDNDENIIGNDTIVKDDEDENQDLLPSAVGRGQRLRDRRPLPGLRSRRRPQRSPPNSRSRSPRRELMPPPPRAVRARTAAPLPDIIVSEIARQSSETRIRAAAATTGGQATYTATSTENEVVSQLGQGYANTPWTRSEASEVVRLRDSGVAFEEIARQLGTGRSAGACRRAALVERRRREQESLGGGGAGDDNQEEADNGNENGRPRISRATTPANSRRSGHHPVTRSSPAPLPPTTITTITTTTRSTRSTPSASPAPPRPRINKLPNAWLPWELEMLTRMRNEENASFDQIAAALMSVPENVSRGVNRSRDICRSAWSRHTRRGEVQNLDTGQHGTTSRMASEEQEEEEDEEDATGAATTAAATPSRSAGRARDVAAWEPWELELMARMREQNVSWDRIRDVLNSDPRNLSKGLVRSDHRARSAFSLAVRNGRVNYNGKMGKIGSRHSADPGDQEVTGLSRTRRKGPDEDDDDDAGGGSGSGRTVSTGLNDQFGQMQLDSQSATTRSRRK